MNFDPGQIISYMDMCVASCATHKTSFTSTISFRGPRAVHRQLMKIFNCFARGTILKSRRRSNEDTGTDFLAKKFCLKVAAVRQS